MPSIYLFCHAKNTHIGIKKPIGKKPIGLSNANNKPHEKQNSFFLHSKRYKHGIITGFSALYTSLVSYTFDIWKQRGVHNGRQAGKIQTAGKPLQ
jgi:hypothetical protein